MNSKKAQITVFIIIGFFILVFSLLFVYFKTSSSNVSDIQAIQRTPRSFEDYIKTCLSYTSEDAIKILGSQGGYTVMPDFISRDDRAFIPLDKNGFFGIPSWFYNGEYRIPPLSAMETEIKSYVESHMDSCLAGFNSYAQNFEVNVKGDGNASVSISDENVLVLYEYPVEVTTKDDAQTQTFSKFQVNVPVQLGKMHELAKRIVYSENKNYFFEKEIINLMSADGDIPITGLDFSCMPKTWFTNTVRDELKKDIYYTVPRVRYKGTDYSSFEAPESDYKKFGGKTLLDLRAGKIPKDKPLDAYDYFHLFFDPNLLPDDYNPEDLDFSGILTGTKFYPENRFAFRVRPSVGAYMTSQLVNFPGTDIAFLCMQNYHFTYDVDFLLETDLYDKHAFYNDGFEFRFALPVTIKSNQPSKEEISFTSLSRPTFYDDPCEDLTGMYDIRAEGLFMGLDNMELDDAEISFDCVSFGCKLGATHNDGGVYRLITGLPSSCKNGYISVKRDGYLPTKIQHLGETDIVVPLKKIKTLDVHIQKHSANDLYVTSALDDGDFVVVKIVPYDYDETSIAQFTSDQLNANMTFVEDDGNYYIDAMLIDDENDRILGGYKGNFTYDFSDIAGKTTLEIPIVEFKVSLPFTPEEQMDIVSYIDGDEYQKILKPTFT